MLALFEKIDIYLFYLINREGQNAFFDDFMPFMSNEKNFYALFALVWLLFVIIGSGLLKRLVSRGKIIDRTRALGWLQAVSASLDNRKFLAVAIGVIGLISLSEWFSSGFLKPIFDRPRPYHSISGVHLYNRMAESWRVTPELIEKIRGQSQSLPSSHATNIFAAAFFFSYFFRRLWPLFYLIALTVGYSRVYLGVHYPFDVLAGIFAGTFCGIAVAWICITLFKYPRKQEEHP